MRRLLAVEVVAAICVALSAAQPAHGTYAGKNGRIASYGSRDDHAVQIWTIGREGTNLRKLTDLTTPPDHEDWSPDGSKIVFEVEDEGHYACGNGSGS